MIFNRKPIDLRMIDPSSKLSLKMSCIEACKGDVKKAKEMYDYFSEGLQLPDYPTPRPSVIQQFTQQAEGLFGWIDQNGDKIMKGYNMFRMFRGDAPLQTVETAQAASEIPPLPPLTNGTV